MPIRPIQPDKFFSLLPFEERRAPPVWIVGSGMTVASGGVGGVPGTEALAQALLSRWNKYASGHSQKQQRAQDISSKHSRKQYSSFKFYQEVTGLFYLDKKLKDDEDLSRTELMFGIQDAVISSQSFVETDIGERDGLEELVWLRHKEWRVRKGLSSLAHYIKIHPRKRDHAVFTTNCDPLISIAMLQAKVEHARAAFEHEDYMLSRVAANVPVIYHVHGYWTGVNTLNLSEHLLIDERRILAASIADEIKGRTIVVMGYGGWDDVIMGALKRALEDDRTTVVWVSHIPISEQILAAFEDVTGTVRTLQHDADDLLVALQKHAKKRSDLQNAQGKESEALEKVKALEDELSQRRSHAEMLGQIMEGVSGIDAKPQRARLFRIELLVVVSILLILATLLMTHHADIRGFWRNLNS